MSDTHRVGRTCLIAGNSLAIACALCVTLLAQGPRFAPEIDAQRMRFVLRELNNDAIQTTLLEIRLAETQPAAGLVRATVQSSGGQVFLHDERLVTTNDVLQARVVESNGRFNVAVTLASAAGARLATATATHTGKPLAIIVDGEVISAPTVRDRIANEALITGDFTREEAERIATGLQR